MDDKYVTTLRLYKNNPVHFQALTCLEAYNRDLFGSQNDFIAEALIYYSEHLKKSTEFEELEGTLTRIKTHEDYFKELTKRALEELLEEVRTAPILCDTKIKEKQALENKNERPAEDAGQATEKDFNLLEFYGSFGEFEDEGEDCL